MGEAKRRRQARPKPKLEQERMPDAEGFRFGLPFRIMKGSWSDVGPDNTMVEVIFGTATLRGAISAEGVKSFKDGFNDQDRLNPQAATRMRTEGWKEAIKTIRRNEHIIPAIGQDILDFAIVMALADRGQGPLLRDMDLAGTTLRWTISYEKPHARRLTWTPEGPEAARLIGQGG